VVEWGGFISALTGASTDPLMWIAAAAVIFLGRSAESFLVSLVIAAAVLGTCWFALVLSKPMTPAALGWKIFLSETALTLWSLIGWGIRVAISKCWHRISK
jgi:hypothetical protein